MNISKKQHKEVIQSLLSRLHSATVQNRESGDAHYKEAKSHEEDTLGYYTAMVDGDRAYERCHKLQDAMAMVTEVTGIHHE